VFIVDGVDVADGDTVELAYGVTSVVVVAEPSDPDATVEVSGGTELVSGDNELVVTVTAADGETTQEYTINLKVALNSDTTLATFTANGSTVRDGQRITVPAYTSEIEVVAVPNEETAEVEISGADALEAGENTVTVQVTAPFGNSYTYSIYVTVLLSTETGISEITVGGETALDGDVIRTTDFETTEVDVEVTTVDENASVEVIGNTDLVIGDNTITILVTAPSGATREYKVTYRIGGLPGNAKLGSLSVADQKIDLDAKNQVINVPAGTKSVPVIAITEETSATIKLFGNNALVAGENVVTVRVTAADAITVREYKVTVVVAALSSDSRLKTLTVNGQSVASGSILTLPAGTRSAEVIGVPYSKEATVRYTGTKNLVDGNNIVIATVTAADGSYTEYRVTLEVARLSSDTSLTVFRIEGANVLGKTKARVIPGITRLRIYAVANSDGASVKINSYLVKPGDNWLVVTVTAADGTTQDYTVKVVA